MDYLKRALLVPNKMSVAESKDLESNTHTGRARAVFMCRGRVNRMLSHINKPNTNQARLVIILYFRQLLSDLTGICHLLSSVPLTC